MNKSNTELKSKFSFEFGNIETREFTLDVMEDFIIKLDNSELRQTLVSALVQRMEHCDTEALAGSRAFNSTSYVVMRMVSAHLNKGASEVCLGRTGVAQVIKAIKAFSPEAGAFNRDTLKRLDMLFDSLVTMMADNIIDIEKEDYSPVGKLVE